MAVGTIPDAERNALAQRLGVNLLTLRLVVVSEKRLELFADARHHDNHHAVSESGLRGHRWRDVC